MRRRSRTASSFHNRPQALSDVLGGVIGTLPGMRQKIDQARTIEAWATLAGPQVNAVTQSVRMRGNRLVVSITSAAWRHALHLQRGQWRDQLNTHLGQRLVQEIVFR